MLIDTYILGDFKDAFKMKYNELKSAEKATELMLAENIEDSDDYDDGPLFWIGLAEAQWDYGVLVEEIKAKAILSIEELINRFEFEKGKTPTITFLNKKLAKLTSPQPSVKKIVNKKYYVCPWGIGDVFAYKFTNIKTNENGYIYFVKIDNTRWYPKHIIPVIYIFNIVTKELLNVEDIKDYPIMPQGYSPLAYALHPEDDFVYKFKLVITKVKETKLFTYLGKMDSLPTPERESIHSSCKLLKNWNEWFTSFFEKWGITIQ